jgi:hypothetical protein
MMKMPVLAGPCIKYELPMSKVCQALKDNGRMETAWNNARIFMEECTTASAERPDSAKIVINAQDDRDTATLENAARARFGIPEEHFDGLYRQSIWRLRQAQAMDALEFLEEHRPYPKAMRPYISLRLDYYFHFVDPISKQPLQQSEAKSHLAVFLQKNSQVMPEFLFPFSDAEAFRAYLDGIRGLLPFKAFDEKSLRLLVPDKKGTGVITRKLPGKPT